jgi:hypothetical protein
MFFIYVYIDLCLFWGLYLKKVMKVCFIIYAL